MVVSDLSFAENMGKRQKGFCVWFAGLSKRENRWGFRFVLVVVVEGYLWLFDVVLAVVWCCFSCYLGACFRRLVCCSLEG